MTMSDVLDLRTLNRTLLQRQHLLEPSDMSALAMIEHLVGLQAQAPNPPYLGLWSRLREFRHDDLAQLLTDRRAVRIVVMRGTVHVVSADDCLRLRPKLQSVLERMYATSFRAEIGELDGAEVAVAARKLVEDGVENPAELGALLAERWPDHQPSVLATMARVWVPMVQLPPRAIWGRGGQPRYATAEAWLGRTPVDYPVESIIERYLGAFGPASVADVQAWSGLTKLREVTDTMGDRLRAYRTEDGRELLDVADGVIADPDTPVSPRFVAEFDNLFLSHADRRRIVSDEHRRVLMTPNTVPAAVLIDGFIRGTWHLKRSGKKATLTITPLVRWPKRTTSSVEGAARGMLAFYADQADTHEVEFRHA